MVGSKENYKFYLGVQGLRVIANSTIINWNQANICKQVNFFFEILYVIDA